MANLTIIIFTKNKEQNLKKCITSFKGVAQRVVIIDSYSTDDTVELAKSLGADVYEHPFENHAAQFNWALDNVDLQTEWVMKVDADELSVMGMKGRRYLENYLTKDISIHKYIECIKSL